MAGIFGPIPNPTNYADEAGSGLFSLISNILKFAGIIAGLFFVVQVIMAGFSYISASGDPKKAELAWAKIWQSIIGLIIVASAFIIASVVGKIFGIDNILDFQIYGPGQ
jgi:Type IV secretion system pilin